MARLAGGQRATAARREEILDAALAVLAERGYAGASTREIAARAHASKETLYAWFGDKRGLFTEVVRRNAARLEAALTPHLNDNAGDPAIVLHAVAAELLRLLLGEPAVVINRAAIAEAPTDPTLAQVLTAEGRSRIVPRLVCYLESQRARGRLAFEDAATAAETLIGLTIGDQQVRRLLGVLPVPTPTEIDARANRAVRAFLLLFSPSP